MKEQRLERVLRIEWAKNKINDDKSLKVQALTPNN